MYRELRPELCIYFSHVIIKNFSWQNLLPWVTSFGITYIFFTNLNTNISSIKNIIVS